MRRMNKEDITISVPTENGDMECHIITVFEVKGRNYIALLPIVESNGEVLIYQYKQRTNDEIELLNIFKEEEFEDAAEMFDKLMKEY